MNARIKELAEQAKQYAREQMAHPMDPELFSASVFQEKFAELIVEECIRFGHDDNGWKPDYMIKEHFGVKNG